MVDIRQCNATTRNQVESCKWSSAMERRAQVQSYVNQTELTNWIYNAITSLLLNDTFVRRTTDLEET